MIQDYYTQLYGIPATTEVLRFCKVQLIHQIWLLLLDPTFVNAYENGFLVKCGDQIVRRLFPRFFVYSADYPERCVPFSPDD